MTGQEENKNTGLERIPQLHHVLAAIALILLWVTGLGVAGWWTWTRGIPNLTPTVSFLLIASLFGALGGVTVAIRELQTFLSSSWLFQKGNPKGEAQGSPLNNLVIKPALWPIPGAALGLVLASIFVDEGTGHIKVALLGLVGGLLWVRVLKKLPAMLDVASDKKKEQVS